MHKTSKNCALRTCKIPKSAPFMQNRTVYVIFPFDRRVNRDRHLYRVLHRKLDFRCEKLRLRSQTWSNCSSNSPDQAAAEFDSVGSVLVLFWKRCTHHLKKIAPSCRCNIRCYAILRCLIGNRIGNIYSTNRIMAKCVLLMIVAFVCRSQCWVL